MSAVGGTGPLVPSRLPRASTDGAHRLAVERALLVIYERFEDEELSLRDLAAAAFSSPYHFERLFRRVTGVSPFHFLAAVRMEAAKRLLVNTGRSVTDVCLDVGYNSLGTFTRRFGQLVGLSPRRFRALARLLASEAATPEGGSQLALRLWEQVRSVTPQAPFVAGALTGPEGFSGLAFVGLFPSSVPEGRPLGCTVALVPGPYRIGPVEDGTYFVLAAALNSSAGPLRQLLGTGELRARGGPVTVEEGVVTGPATLALRPALAIDPPIVVAPGGLLHVLAAGSRGRWPARRRIRRASAKDL